MALDRTAPGLTIQARAEIDKYLAAYAKDPRSRAFAALAEAYRRAGMLDEAIKVAEDGLQNHPQLPSALATLGRAYFQKGDLEKARPLLERVIAQSPDNLAAQRALGELYFQLGESQLARTALQAVLRASPADPEAQLRLQQLAPPPAPLGAQVPPPAPPAPLGAQVPSPAQSSAAPLSELNKMDLFFESVDVSHSAPPLPLLDYQVRSAKEIFSDLEEEKRRSPITTETLARLLLKQGYADKARVIFEGILTANPSRQDLLPEINRLRQQAGLTPFEPQPAPTLPPLGAQVPPAPSLGARVPPTPSLGARVPPPAQPSASPAAPPKPAPPKPTVWDIPEPAPASTVPAAEPVPPAPALGAQVPPTPSLGARVPPPAQPSAPSPPARKEASPSAAQVPPTPSLGARVPPPAQKAPQPAIASPPAKPGPPTKAEKVEALKEILERIKKGNKP